MAVAVEAIDSGQPVSFETEGPSRLGRPFWRVWSAATISNLGDGLALVAFPLAAASLTSRAGLIAGVAVALRVPWLLFGLPSGALADRLNRARVMGLADLGRMGVVAMVGLAASTGVLTLPVLYLAAFVLGSLETLYAAASQAAIPALVADKDLDRANGYLFASETSGGELAGPAVGGLLFVAAAGLPFVLDGLSFLVSAVLLLGLRRRLPAPRSEESASLRSETRAGLRYFLNHRVLRLLAVLIGASAFFQAMVMAVLVVFAVDALGLSEGSYGVFLSAGAIGSVAGGLAAHRLKALLGSANLLIGSAGLAAVAYVIVGTTASATVAVLGFVLETFAVGCGSVASLTLRQSLVPDAMRGRVSNAFRVCIWGAMPLGALVGGILAEVGGVRVAIVMAGALQLVVVAGFAGKLSRRIQTVEIPEPIIVFDIATA